MHWPKVSARTATPVSIGTTSVTPGMAVTSARLATAPGLPLMVGGRQTMVGFAPGTSRSIANFLRPVTASRASIRSWGRPMTVKSSRAVSRTSTGSERVAAALGARAPMPTAAPERSWTAPSRRVRRATGAPSSAAAAVSSRWRATAAATRMGVKVAMVVLEAPVSWLNSSSGRASASVTRTRSSGTASSSETSMAVEVVMPCPTSARGRAKETVPSASTSTVMRPEVGSAAAVMTSLRSRSSVRSGAAGAARAAGAGASWAAATRVGAAST